MPTANPEHAQDRPDDFDTFYRAEYPVLVRIALGIVRDRHLAEDVAQDVLIAAEPRFAGAYASGHARAWSRIACSHAALNTLRERGRRSRREENERQAGAPPDPGDAVLASERDEEVRAVLAKLPRHAATVLVLRHSGLSYAEVADVMGVRANQVGTMLRRAEARFRKEIDRATRS